MKKAYFFVFFLIALAGMVCADDNFKWDMVNALVNNDLQKIDILMKNNINTLSAAEKRLVMGFALTYSRNENTTNVMETLMRYNIRPNSFDLYTAINRNQSNALIQLMLQNGSSPNGEILLLAMEKRRFDLARQFAEAGVDVNYQYPLSKNYADGMTALLYASKWNNFELVRLFLERGANINAKASDGNTALSMAQANGNGQMYNYLMERGAREAGGVSPPQNAGIGSFMDTQIFNFQRGTYRLSGSSKYIRFTGSANSGSVNFVDGLNTQANSGLYRVVGNNMTITMNGRTFEYKVDSGESFSGSGEVWVRTGN